MKEFLVTRESKKQSTLAYVFVANLSLVYFFVLQEFSSVGCTHGYGRKRSEKSPGVT
jgi:hypothetical protein